MRGIPRQAVEQNCRSSAPRSAPKDIADQESICPWNPDMYGVDMSKPGAQAYYDCVFKLFASWGVDFVKVDDIAPPVPYEGGDRGDPSGDRQQRPADGAEPVARRDAGRAAEHVMKHANMWRISDDFWDNWRCSMTSSSGSTSGLPIAAPGAGPTPTCCRSARSAGSADRDSRATSSAR